MSDAAEQPPLTGSILLLTAFTLSLANFLVVLDTTISNVSIPTISGDLGVSTNEGIWVITSYAVGEAITVPLTGWLSTRYGQIRLFVMSVCAFTLMSFLCGIAPNLGVLVGFRLLQGLSGGPMIPLSATLLVSIFGKSKSTTALALWGLTTVVAPILGPVLGGVICDNGHWSLIFWINVPFGIGVAVASWMMLHERETATRHERIDVVGLILLVVFVLSFQILLDKGRDLDWFSSGFILACAITAAISFILFVIWETTDASPIVDLSVFRSRTWVVSTLTLALMFGLFIGNIVVTPLWLQEVMAYTPTWAGYATAPIGILAVVTAPIVGKLLAKIDPRLIVSVGMSVLAISFFMRAHLNTDATFGDIFLPLLVIGAGVPACIVTLTALGVSDLRHDRQAGGSGLQNFIRVLALAAGSSLSQTYWDHATRMERANLVGELSRAGVDTTLKAAMTQGLPHEAALQSFSGLVDLQSAMLATNDFYAAATLLILVFTGVIWFAKRPKGPLEGGAGH